MKWISMALGYAFYGLLVPPVSAAPVCDANAMSRSAMLFSSADVLVSSPLLSTADDASCASLSIAENAVPGLLSSFGFRPESARTIGFSLQDSVDNWFWRLEGARLSNPVDASTDVSRLDGSYLGFRFETWQVIAGRPERWWGPGWQGSLFAGTNARPPIGITLETHEPVSLEHWLLAWTGDMHFSLFANQLESERFVPRAKQFGFRWTMRPTEDFEVALTRTAMFGGEGRPENARSFFYMIIGNDNRTVNRVGSPLDPEDEPGNQLGGVDARWQTAVSGPHALALYSQLAGEDRDGYLPSKLLWLGGAEVSSAGFPRQWRVYLEGAVTSADALRAEEIFNTAYNHGIYRDGYRYLDRSMGHPMDNDGIQQALGGALQYASRHAVNLQLRRSRLNRDGVGLNTVSPVAADVRDARIEYSYRLQHLTFTVSGVWEEWREGKAIETEKGLAVGMRVTSTSE